MTLVEDSAKLYSQRAMIKPYLFALLAVTCYSFIGPLAKKFGLLSAPYTFIAIYSAAMFPVALGLAFWTKESFTFSSLTTTQLMGIVACAVINIVGWVLYLKALQVLPVAHYDLMAGAGIVVTALIASFMLGEPLYLRYIPATALIVGGIWLGVRPG